MSTGPASSGTPTGFPGWDVPSIGRRLVGLLLDSVLGLGATVLLFVVLIAVGWVAAGLFWISWFAFILYTELGLAATPGQLILKMRQIDATTGRPSGRRTFGKYLLMGVLGQLTLGIILVLALFSMQPPLRRSWFDRMAGVIVGQRCRAAVPTAGPNAIPLSAVRPLDGLTVLPIESRADPAISRPSKPAWPESMTAPASAVSSQGVLLSAPPPWAVAASADPHREHEFEHPAPTPSPCVVLDDGTPLSGTHGYVLGRDPVPPSTHPDAVPHAVDDPERSLSKTHLLLGFDAHGVSVTDLHSTNGVRVTDAEGRQRILVPGISTLVPAGSVVTYGKRTLRVAS